MSPLNAEVVFEELHKSLAAAWRANDNQEAQKKKHDNKVKILEIEKTVLYKNIGDSATNVVIIQKDKKDAKYAKVVVDLAKMQAPEAKAKAEEALANVVKT